MVFRNLLIKEKLVDFRLKIYQESRTNQIQMRKELRSDCKLRNQKIITCRIVFRKVTLIFQKYRRILNEIIRIKIRKLTILMQKIRQIQIINKWDLLKMLR